MSKTLRWLGAVAICSYALTAASPSTLSDGIYLADHTRIIRVDDVQGHGWTTFGSRGSGRGQFLDAVAIALDSRGRIYVADSGNHRIVRFDDLRGNGWVELSGVYTSEPVRRLADPRALAVDANGRIYIADRVGSYYARVVRIDDMTGAGWTQLGDVQKTAHHFYMIDGIALDGRGRLYVLDLGARLVRVNDISGAGWSSSGCEQPCVTDTDDYTSISVTASGDVYVTDVNDVGGRIARLRGLDLQHAAYKDREFGNGLDHVTVDSSGRIYVIDAGVVYRLDGFSEKGIVELKGRDERFDPQGIAIPTVSK